MKALKLVFTKRMLWQHAIAASVAVLVVAVSAWGRVDPVEVLDSELIKNAVPPGGTLDLTRHVKWLRKDCTDVFVSAELIDSQKIVHALPKIDLGPPRTDVTNTGREWPVPVAMPWGPSVYKGHLTFYCLPFYWLWPIEIDLPPLKFETVMQ